MGGNVFKGVSVRLSQEHYLTVCNHVVSELRALMPQGKVFAVPSYGAKNDFGDLDVLISSGALNTSEQYLALKATTEELFGALDWVRNGPVVSIDYRKAPVPSRKAFQVDLIRQEEDSYDYGLCYFSFNDLGNLLGRIAHAMGVAHRHDGLYWYLRDGTYLFDEIQLTKEYSETLEFLGLDPGVFEKGFHELEEVFQYVASSPYFRPEIYLLENRNHASRIRDRKRKTYTKFLDWCKANSSVAEPLPEDKSVWFERIQQFFPHFETKRAELSHLLAENRQAKEKFNGKRVSELTGLTGKALGKLMQTIRAGFQDDKAFIQYVLSTSEEELKALILRTVRELH